MKLQAKVGDYTSQTWLLMQRVLTSCCDIVVLLLRTRLTPGYPDELPDLSIDIVQEGDDEEQDEDDAEESEAQLTEEDIDTLLRRLKEAVRPAVDRMHFY